MSIHLHTNPYLNVSRVGRFGGCPECGHNYGCVLLGDDPWFFCARHPKRWAPSTGMDDWEGELNEGDGMLVAYEVFSAFEVVEPAMNPKYGQRKKKK
jgi:hypothetical protein